MQTLFLNEFWKIAVNKYWICNFTIEFNIIRYIVFYLIEKSQVYQSTKFICRFSHFCSKSKMIKKDFLVPNLFQDAKIFNENHENVGKFKNSSLNTGLGLLRIDKALQAKHLKIEVPKEGDRADFIECRTRKPKWWPDGALKISGEVLDNWWIFGNFCVMCFESILFD